MLNLRPHRRLALLGRLFGDALAQQPAPPPASSPHARARHLRRPGARDASPLPGSLRRPTPSFIAPCSSAPACVTSLDRCRRRRQAVRRPDPASTARCAPSSRNTTACPSSSDASQASVRGAGSSSTTAASADARVNDRARAQPIAARRLRGRSGAIDLLERARPGRASPTDAGSSRWWSRRAAPPSIPGNASRDWPPRRGGIGWVLHPRSGCRQLHAVNTQHRPTAGTGADRARLRFA